MKLVGEKGNRAVVFGPNKIKFFQDFAFWQGVPNAPKFRLREVTDKAYVLVADGYGSQQPGEKYGNGSIFVWNDQLTANEKRLLRRTQQRSA